jgi:hypothetical protein
LLAHSGALACLRGAGEVKRAGGAAMFGKVRVMITDAPRHIVVFENGKRTRLFPVVAGR